MEAMIDQFRLITQAIPDPICLLSGDAVLRAANPAFTRLLSIPETDLLNKGLGELSENTSQDIEQNLNAWRRSGSPLPSSIDFYTKYSGAVKCTTYGNLLKASSDPAQALILLRVKTRQNTNKGFSALNDQIKQLEKQVIERKRAAKELQESESRIRLILESAGEMIFGIDIDGNLTFVNPAFFKIMGYDQDITLLGQDAFQIIRHSGSDMSMYSKAQDPIYQCIHSERPVHSDAEFFTRKDGTYIPIEYRSFPIVQENKVVGAVVTATDITERRHAQDEIIRLNQGLERRVEERTVELERAIKKLAQSEKLSALGELVAGVAHEINTPIGIGVTSATHLQEKVNHYRRLYNDSKLTQGDFESFLKVSEDSCNILVANLNRSANLVRSFKQVAVDQVSESRRDFNVRQYIEEVIQSLHPKLKQTKHVVHIDCDDNIIVNSFPGAFAQIITNLVINSLIHGFEHEDSGQITIDISESDDSLIFRYSDNGVGMDEDGVRKIFDPFYSTRRGRGGTGLGMHVVYNLVTNTFNGSIDCESAPQSGVQFLMKLHTSQEGSVPVSERKQG